MFVRQGVLRSNLFCPLQGDCQSEEKAASALAPSDVPDRCQEGVQNLIAAPELSPSAARSEPHASRNMADWVRKDRVS